MSERGPPIILERAEHWIGVDLIAGRGEKAAPVITAKVVTQRGDRPGIAKDGRGYSASVYNRIPDPGHVAVVDGAAGGRARVTTDRAVGNRQWIKPHEEAASPIGGVAADRAIAHDGAAEDTTSAPGRVIVDRAVVDYWRAKSLVSYAAAVCYRAVAAKGAILN